jgi:multifunctional beta-oxidation protein
VKSLAVLTCQCVKACWPYFQKQKYGRIVTTASPNGICKYTGLITANHADGTIGQANYSTAKAAISGLTRTLAIEGSRANINVNCLAPRAGTAMTMTVWPKEMIEAMKVRLGLSS